MSGDAGSQRFATLIKTLRKQNELTQKQLADLSGVSQPNISYIERGLYNTEKITLATLMGLASAFNVDVGELTSAIASIIESEDSDQQTTQIDLDREILRPAPNLIISERPTGPSASFRPKKVPPVESLIATGEALAAKQNWKKALADYYLPALDLTQDRDAKVRLMIDRLAPTYANLCDFEAADIVLEEAANLYESLCLDHEQEGDPEILSSITEQRGYSAIHRGDFKASYEHYLQSRSSSQELGARKQEASSYHFVGRLLIEDSTAQFFPALIKPKPFHAESEVALAHIEISKGIHTDIVNEPAANFDRIWKARGLLLNGQYYEARDLIHNTLQFFEDAGIKSGMGHALLELARISLLSGGEHDIRSTRQQIRAILVGPMADTQHPFIVARLLVLVSYCDFLLGDFRSNRRIRWLAADACNLVKRVYPYPQHPLPIIADLLYMYFINAMDEREYQEYERTLEMRMQEGHGEVFQFIGNFYLSHVA